MLALVAQAPEGFPTVLARGGRRPLARAVAEAEREDPHLALAMVEERAAAPSATLAEEARGRLAAVEALDALARTRGPRTGP